MSEKQINNTLMDELIYDLEPCILDRTKDEYKRLLNMLISIFSRLPKEDADEILFVRNPFFILPLSNSARPLHFHFIYNSDGKDIKERVKKIETKWFVMLKTELIEAPKEELIYIIAHELAHVFLNHTDEIIEKDRDRNYEIEADKQVVKWGFEEELKKAPTNYLYAKKGTRYWEK